MKTKSQLWSQKAKKYPIYDESDLDDMKTIRNVIKIAESHGVEIDGMDVLDIGSGTGRYSFNLAKKAKLVQVTDVSDEMIRILEETKIKYGFKNIFSSVDDWNEISIAGKKWSKKFDTAWAAMTSAVCTAEDILKMNECSKKWCVCVAWGRKRDNALLAEIMKSHGGKLEVPFGTNSLSGEFKKLGIKHTLDYVENSWESEGEKAEVASDMAWHLEINGFKPDFKIINKILDGYSEKNRIVHKTSMEMGIMTWKIKN
ncbi:MAG: class I SAM-dependent methyltransferase [Candidatus Wallbacteria bacterium]